MKRIKPAHIVIAIVLIAVAVFAIPQILSDQPGARSVSDNVVTETIGVVETNAVVAFQVTLVEGSDAEHESDHMFEALTGLPGVGEASLDTQTLELTVAYDDAVIDPAPIRERLVAGGYIAPTRDDAAATEVTEDGSVQRISISDDGVHFDPNLILAKAGIPIEMEFAPGQDCRVVVKFSQIGVEQNIAEGGTVNLPALEQGEYEITCSGDAHEGILIVE